MPTTRQRILATLHGEPVDRIPWAPRWDPILGTGDNVPTDAELPRLVRLTELIGELGKAGH